MKSHSQHGKKAKGNSIQEKPHPPLIDAKLKSAAIPNTLRKSMQSGVSQTDLTLPSHVYLIGCGNIATPADVSAQTMGFKAWNLHRMAQMSLPVPPAFVLGTYYCSAPEGQAKAKDQSLWQAGLQALESATHLDLGDTRRPLLLSVRSGAAVSMPGMMETILNVGLCDHTIGALLRQTGNPRLVWDAYRRLIASYGEVVEGIASQHFEDATSALYGTRDERELDFAELRTLSLRFLDVYQQTAGRIFPQDPKQQLSGAINAVLASWQSSKASEYRRMNHISDTLGTAVTIQSMVFGNSGGQSGSGVGFTRNPVTGEAAPWVDFLFNAQGEDVVSGRRNAHGHEELAAILPNVWQALLDATQKLEHNFADMQDFEFTVQEGRLFMLQTRSGKRTPYATARIALDMLDEGLIDSGVARERTAGLTHEVLAQPRIVAASGEALVPLASAASASNGVATGEIALDEARAVARHATGVAVVLVRRDAETSDIAALELAAGLLTQRGARTSHAAVVARQLGKVCLVSCTELQIDENARTIKIGGTTLHEGDLLTLDGNEGKLYAGSVKLEIDYPLELLARLEALSASQHGTE
jgi:pyruvate,orthophosphate dikinase